MKRFLKKLRRFFTGNKPEPIRWWRDDEFIPPDPQVWVDKDWLQRRAPKKEKWISAGGVVIPSMRQTDKVYVILPSNKYGPWSFPKGKVDLGETKEKAAVREVWEETGLKAKILPGGYVGKGEGTHSFTHFYMMVQVGGRPRRTDETDETRLVTFDEARRLFKSKGNRRDVRIANLAQSWIEENL